jgi:hypothetical protein
MRIVANINEGRPDIPDGGQKGGIEEAVRAHSQSGNGGPFYTYILITYLPHLRSPIASFFLVVGSYVILTGYTSINALVKSELFPAHVRAHSASALATPWRIRPSAGRRH